MRRTRRLSLTLLCVLPAALSAAPAAHADAFTDVFQAYSKSGTINPCKFTAAQLKQAKGQIPNDYAQYAPDFKDAIDAAAKARAAGGCRSTSAPGRSAAGAPGASPGGTSGGGTPAPGGGPAAPAPATPAPAAGPSATLTPQPAPSVVPAPAVADGAILAAAADPPRDNGGGAPAPLVALAIVALLMALVAAVVASARWFAVDPPWLQRSRHATAEAGWRTSAAWAEFTDWLRLGR